MNRPVRNARLGFGRAILTSLGALAVGGILALGFSAPAFATSAFNFTVHITTAAGSPVTAVDVYAYQVAQGEEAPGDPAPEAVAISGRPGYYLFSGSRQLLSGPTYTLGFIPTGTAATTSFSQLLGGVSEFDNAQTFTVGTTPGSITSISASLANTAVISGKVTGPTGKPVSGADVQSYSFTGSQWYARSDATTNSHGEYTLADLVPGSYELEVYAPNDVYPPVFSGGHATFGSAVPFLARSGSTVTYNIAFPPFTGSIVGAASFAFPDGGVGPLSLATPAAYPVTAEDTNGHASAVDTDREVFGARVTSDGSWSIGGLPPGDYVVEMFPWYYNEPAAYVAEDDSATLLSGATVFHVGSGATNAGGSIFNTQDEGGSVTISVTNASDAPVALANVLLTRTSNSGEYYQGTTDEDGEVTFGASGGNSVIRPGEFTVTVLGDTTRYEPYETQYVLNPGAQNLGVQLANLLHAPGFVTAPYISQTATVVGTQYSVLATPFRSDASLSYQWLRNGHPIYGADATSYVSRPADVGATLSVRVDASSPGFADVFATATVSGVVTDSTTAPLLVSPPALSSLGGSIAHAGTVLDVSPGTWSVAGLHFSYQWFEDGDPISDTGSTYLVTADDIGHTFSAQVNATGPGYASAAPAVTQNSVTVTHGPDATPIGKMVVTSTTAGVPNGSKRFTVAPGAWTGLDPSFSYTWHLGSAVVGTDSPTYVETESAANLSQPLTVQVHDVVAGFDPGSSSVSARAAQVKLALLTQPFATLVAGGPAVTGSTSVTFGRMLSVGGSSKGTWVRQRLSTQPADALTFTFQWFRASGSGAAHAIPGATSSSYSATLTDIGYRLSFVETAHSGLWGSAASGLVPAGTVVGETTLVDSPPTITLPAQGAHGGQLQAVVSSSWAVAGASVSYQWYRCAPAACSATAPMSSFAKIPGATSSSYTPTDSDGGDRLYLAATATEPGFATARATSGIVQIVADNVLITGTLTITSDPRFSPAAPAQVGQVSFASWGTLGNQSWTLPTVTYSFLWQTCSSDCDSASATWSTGSPGTSGTSSPSQYTPTVADWASGAGYLRVTETASAAGYLTVTKTSAVYPIQVSPIDIHTGVLQTMFAHDDPGDQPQTYSIVHYGDYTGTVVSWQWYIGDTYEPGATVDVEDPDTVDAPVYAVVTYTLAGYQTVTVVITALYESVASDSPAVNSTTGAAYGDTLNITNPSPWSDLPTYPDADWTLSYQWCNATTCEPASSDPAFTPPASWVGTTPYVVISDASPLVQEPLVQKVSMPQPLAYGPAIDPATNPQLSWSGDLIPGTALTVSTPAYAASGVAVTYQWELSADDGATWTSPLYGPSDTFTPNLTQGGELVRAVVIGTKSGYATAVHDSEIEQIQVGDIIRELTAPVISGNPAVDGELVLDPGEWTHDVSLQIQWMLDGQPIPGATGDDYVPAAADFGDEISAEVTASRAGQLDVSDQSNHLTIVQAAAPVSTVAPTISGLGTIASPLVVTNGGWNVSGLAYSYQWADGDGPIDGANTNSLVLSTGDTESDVSVTISALRYGYAAGQVVAG